MTYPANHPGNVASDHLRAFVERVERLEEEIKALNGDKSEVYSEAKGNGFDVPTIKKVVRIRKMDEDSRQEADVMLDLYMSALGMVPASDDEEYSTPLVHVHTHVENIEKFDAETGEIIETSSQAPVDSSPIADAVPSPAGAEGEVDRQPIPEPALVPREIAEPGDRGAVLPSAATVVPTLGRPHDPGTHFLNSDNLMRLHGCLEPDMCSSSTPRVKLCSTCSAKLDVAA